MAATEIITLRLDAMDSRRLAKLSKATDRTRSRLAAEAITRYLDDNLWQIEAIEAGVQAADRGELVPQDDVERLIKSWRKPRQPKRAR